MRDGVPAWFHVVAFFMAYFVVVGVGAWIATAVGYRWLRKKGWIK